MAEVAPKTAGISSETREQREPTFDKLRRWGYLAARLDPLGFLPQASPAELDDKGPWSSEARAIYCRTIGAEFMHIADAQRREWIAARMEYPSGAKPDQHRILERLVRAELFEQTLQARFVGTKRYSLEGLAVLIPLLDHIVETGAALGVDQIVLAMSHRGRLNVMVQIVGRPPAEIFADFEDVDPRSVLGGGDVKYHVGATGEYHTTTGRAVEVHLVSNPSHLEAVDPVAMGRARAKQARISGQGWQRVLPVTLHGDAAFAGQGIWAETLNMGNLSAYTVGGTIHIIVNNLLGFTTPPVELHSSPFASDLAKRQSIPIFHVNGEDPDAVVSVAEIAVAYRAQFSSDVVIDLIGFRRHGHSEVDDPTITQPRLYAKIKDHPALWQIYSSQNGLDAGPAVVQVRMEFDEAFGTASRATKKPVHHQLPSYWEPYARGCYDQKYEVSTRVDAAQLGEIAAALTRYPEGFAIHPKVKRLLEQRLEMGHGSRPVDYGMAEAFAFGTLLLEGIPVRLTGQDSRRGTFNQRHAALIDTQTEAEHVPLEHLSPGQARCEIFNSPLSEVGVLGFEYGYSRDYPEALVAWEAQFGDFANGAQVIIDQFISAAEDKWDLPSGVVLLLPHGYEGQGPEHSSARMERFLQLAAEDNLQICQPSTAAQYFHLLRRQALRRWRKPLVVFTPKSMLRRPEAASVLADFSEERFLNVIPEREIEDVRRILICTGKIGHELRAERKRRGDTGTAVVFLDQLYPFPEAELSVELARHNKAREIVWVQEEPANMGALFYILSRIRELTGDLPLRSIKRSASASPATGSARAHELEQKTLLTLAFTTSEN
ncbi:MAG: 2-oxoglutarate dehydrogenase E1 component [Acidobacteria bacterium]|nr:MAG: 2-oxoglutarate dehydrogenase E1 component [Acidobacteriota bacterium]